MRKPVIGVMGGSSATERTAGMARELGRLIAEHGWVLLNGGRNVGVMAAVSEGAHAAGGLVVGVLPDMSRAKASPHLDVAIVTGLGDARNLINVLSSDVVVACRGELGTLSEVVLALKHDKRVILLDFPLNDPPFERYLRNGLLTLVDTATEAVLQVEQAWEKVGA